MSKFPKSIIRMIETAYQRGWSSAKIATHINKSKTAQSLGVTYSTRTIAAKVANITRKV